MADVQILASGSSAAPLDYVIPGAQEILIKNLSASFNGAGTGSTWQPAIVLIAPGGKEVGTFPVGDAVAAGASADVSWFPRGGVNTAATPAGGGLQFNAGTYGPDNVGDWLMVETTDFIGIQFSQPSALNVHPDDYSMAFNNALGMLVTGPQDQLFNTGDAMLTIIDKKNTGNFGAFGFEVVAEDTTGAGDEGVLGLTVLAEGNQDTGGAVEGLGVLAVNASGAADAYALEGIGRTDGTGTAYGLYASGQTTGSATKTYGAKIVGQSGGAAPTVGLLAIGHKDIFSSSNAVALQAQIELTSGNSGLSTTLQCLDHTGASIFEVRDDGSVHILTGTSVVADL